MGWFSDIFEDPVGSLISAGSSLIGGVFQNSSAERIASDTNSTSVELANTAHQREVKDLTAAGLNPILSARSGGSATPPIASAPVTNVANNAVSSALQSATIRSQLENIAADTEAKRENAKLSREQQVVARETAQNVAADYWLKDAQMHLTRANEATAVQTARSARVNADMEESYADLQRKLFLAGGSAKALGSLLSVAKPFAK